MSKDGKTAEITPNKYRTHSCNQLGKSDVGQKIKLSGWVHSRRDHGGLIFIDLRDKYGITQLTFDPKEKETFAIAETLRSEWVIHIEGKVADRPTEMVNKKLATGDIEVEVTSIEVLSSAKALPFELDKAEEVNEDLRLQYRFIDLRREKMQKIMRMRDTVISHVRDYMHKTGFTEVQTPILANSSPEGARDFLVPSRLYPGKFFALPQAPQQFKQLLMVGGLDKYFQIAPCFRDEDPRADRHAGAFYQIDMEMSFVEQEDIFAVVEPLMIELTKTFTDKKVIEEPFPKISWREAMNKYGTDKPDLRYELYITDVSDIVRGSEFSVFESALKDGVIHALHIADGKSFTRKDIDQLTEIAKQRGAGGLAYVTIGDDGIASPILKYLGEEKGKAVTNAVKAKPGDIIFFGAGSWLSVCRTLGAVREAAAEKLNLKDKTKAAWCWVVDFPMYEADEETGKIDFSHNPFSMPQGGMEALENDDPTAILGYQYDLALNGFEISSGAIRNHRPDIMYKAFEIAGYTKEQVDAKFGSMLRAFEYGAPPHGGFAPGIDRLLMVLLDLENIRDIYAFPKNGKGQDVMMNAPSEIDEQLLKDLHIEVELEE